MMPSVLKVLLAISSVSMAQDRLDIKLTFDNLWESMDPVAGISTSGAHVHYNVFDTLIGAIGGMIRMV